MRETYSIDILQWIVVVLGYLLTITTSGIIVRHFIDALGESSGSDSESSVTKTRYDLGAIIGKCENLLIITLILSDAFTGLALIFTAKSIVRSEAIKKDPKYYLGGTLVNFTYSVLMGFLIRVLLHTIGHPI